MAAKDIDKKWSSGVVHPVNGGEHCMICDGTNDVQQAQASFANGSHFSLRACAGCIVLAVAAAALGSRRSLD